MTRTHKAFNLLGVLVPFIGLIVAIVLLWGTDLVDWTDLAVLAGMYVGTCLGVTLGFHRLLTHRSFQTKPWVERTLAVVGSMAVQGPVMTWVADHRKHHAHTDQDGDPHSPHTHGGSGFRAAAKGLLYAHMGWLFDRAGMADPARYARDVYEDPAMRRIDRLFPLWIAVGILIPFSIGYAVDGTLAGALTAAVWGGAVRIFLLHHVTWSINSVCHFFGSRRFAVEDHSTNVAWLSLLSMGESWHHNHHAFPRSARHGLRWYEVDVTAYVIRALRATGLAWNVVEISPERQRQRMPISELSPTMKR